jgi:hypothetical protein
MRASAGTVDRSDVVTEGDGRAGAVTPAGLAPPRPRSSPRPPAGRVSLAPDVLHRAARHRRSGGYHARPPRAVGPGGGRQAGRTGRRPGTPAGVGLITPRVRDVRGHPRVPGRDGPGGTRLSGWSDRRRIRAGRRVRAAIGGNGPGGGARHAGGSMLEDQDEPCSEPSKDCHVDLFGRRWHRRRSPDIQIADNVF